MAKIHPPTSVEEECITVLEFKIEGMTCVNCSTAIEKGLTIAFAKKGLVQDASRENSGVNVVLLMHKMRIAFYKETMNQHKVTPADVVTEVEDLGFDASLLNTFELQAASEHGSARSNMGDGNGEVLSKIKTSTFIVRGMTCASCSGSIETHFNKSVEGAISINISLLTNRAVVEHDSSKLRPR